MTGKDIRQWAQRDGESLRLQSRAYGKARATCSADPFSPCAVYRRSGVRLRGALDQTTKLGGSSLLQSSGRRGGQRSSDDYRTACLAVATGRATAERHASPSPP